MRHTKYEGINGLYRKVRPIKKKSMNNPLRRVFYRYRQGTTYGLEMYQKHSTSFVMGREIQLGATMRCYFISTELEKLTSLIISSAKADGGPEGLIPPIKLA